MRTRKSRTTRGNPRRYFVCLPHRTQQSERGAGRSSETSRLRGSVGRSVVRAGVAHRHDKVLGDMIELLRLLSPRGLLCRDLGRRRLLVQRYGGGRALRPARAKSLRVRPPAARECVHPERASPPPPGATAASDCFGGDKRAGCRRRGAPRGGGGRRRGGPATRHRARAHAQRARHACTSAACAGFRFILPASGTGRRTAALPP